MVACEFLISTVQAVLALRRFALRNFSHTNFYDEAHTNCIVRHPDVKSLIRNLPNKNENAKDETSPSKSVSQNVSQSECQSVTQPSSESRENYTNQFTLRSALGCISRKVSLF